MKTTPQLVQDLQNAIAGFTVALGNSNTGDRVTELDAPLLALEDAAHALRLRGIGYPSERLNFTAVEEPRTNAIEASLLQSMVMPRTPIRTMLNITAPLTYDTQQQEAKADALSGLDGQLVEAVWDPVTATLDIDVTDVAHSLIF